MIYWVYILASRSRVLYIGVTSNLPRRLAQHREGGVNAFTAEYHVHRLVYCEQTGDAQSALKREKQLKGWRRLKKLDLVESVNPDWKDLSPPVPVGNARHGAQGPSTAPRRPAGAGLRSG